MSKKPIHIRFDLSADDVLTTMFFIIKKERGNRQNTEVLRNLIKEEYDRLLDTTSVEEETLRDIDGFVTASGEGHHYESRADVIKAAIQLLKLRSTSS